MLLKESLPLSVDYQASENSNVSHSGLFSLPEMTWLTACDSHMLSLWKTWIQMVNSGYSR